MQYQNEINLINDLLCIADFKFRLSDGKYGIIPKDPSYQFKRYHQKQNLNDEITNRIEIHFSDASRYHQRFEAIYTQKHDIYNTISKDSLIAYVYWLLKKIFVLERQCTAEDIREFLSHFQNKQLLEYHILTEIYGITGDLSQPLSLGGFNIIRKETQQDFIQKYTGQEKYLKFKFFPKFESEYLIECRVKARDPAKAIEIAFQKYDSFESVFRFVVGDTRRLISPGIFNFKGHQTSRMLFFSTDGLGSSHRAIEMFFSLDINDSSLIDSLMGFNRVWKILACDKRTELEEKILSSIEWIGKAIYEPDKRKSIIQYVFAIENLLMYNEGKIITPSIVSQLSESLAFILGSNLEERKRITKEFRDVYTVRSAITHGGNKVVDYRNLENAMLLSRGLITNLLTNPIFFPLKTLKALFDWTTIQKFS